VKQGGKTLHAAPPAVAHFPSRTLCPRTAAGRRSAAGLQRRLHDKYTKTINVLIWAVGSKIYRTCPTMMLVHRFYAWWVHPANQQASTNMKECTLLLEVHVRCD
jgi:hypothetical protein